MIAAGPKVWINNRLFANPVLVNNGKKVIVTFDSPDLGTRYYNRCIHQFGECSIAETALINRQPYLSEWNNILRRRHDINIFSQTQFLMHDGKFDIFGNSGVLLFRDNHHLSFYGSDYIAKKIVEFQKVE